MTFFLEFTAGKMATTKQMFRLEWDNWTLQDKPNKAAYPHWQFDYWLTGPDTALLDKLRSIFVQAEREAVVFESAERQIRDDDLYAQSGRPDLRWFTRLHFPALAPWATSPIATLDNAEQPHRSMPNSTKEIEDWVDSALCYLKSELAAYAIYG